VLLPCCAVLIYARTPIYSGKYFVDFLSTSRKRKDGTSPRNGYDLLLPYPPNSSFSLHTIDSTVWYSERVIPIISDTKKSNVLLCLNQFREDCQPFVGFRGSQRLKILSFMSHFWQCWKFHLLFLQLLSSYRVFFKKGPSRTEHCKMDGGIVRYETKMSAIQRAHPRLIKSCIIQVSFTPMRSFEDSTTELHFILDTLFVITTATSTKFLYTPLL
jgi:hypothetical protein